ncbi:hypothetical protein LCGC14_0164340 [marine sediment metagenome]|uniref:Uncharacterized protein n=1 Tax=marine sediment metagenome TaxID=412755 RepID=A0A0F9UUT9_9ZZZZ
MAENTYRCSVCERDLPESSFHKQSRKAGKAVRRRPVGYKCRTCRTEYRKRWYRNGGNASVKSTNQRQRLTNPKIRMLHAARKRAKKLGLPCSLSKEDFEIPKICPVLGIHLEITLGGITTNTPTMDRVDNSKGYVPGNVQVISWRANMIKRDATIPELEAIIRYMRKFSPAA